MVSSFLIFSEHFGPMLFHFRSIDELRSEISHLSLQKALTQKQIDDDAEEANKLRTQLEESRQVLNASESTLREKDQTILQLSLQLNEKTTELDSVQPTLQSKIAEINREVETKDHDLLSVRSQLQTALNQLASVHSADGTLAKIRSELEAVQQKYHQAQNDNALLSRIIEQVRLSTLESFSHFRIDSWFFVLFAIFLLIVHLADGRVAFVRRAPVNIMDFCLSGRTESLQLPCSHDAHIPQSHCLEKIKNSLFNKCCSAALATSCCLYHSTVLTDTSRLIIQFRRAAHTEQGGSQRKSNRSEEREEKAKARKRQSAQNDSANEREEAGRGESGRKR